MKSESEVAQLCPTLCDPMDCSLTGSSVHGIFQVRVLEWGAITFFEETPEATSFIHLQKPESGMHTLALWRNAFLDTQFPLFSA